jgi:hypothetical protein
MAYEWCYLGKLSKYNEFDAKCKYKKGFYVHIFPGTPSRIIYVGTAHSDFRQRHYTHWSLFRNAGYTIFSAEPTDDIYEKGMSLQKEELREDYHHRMQSLAKRGEAWIPVKDWSKDWETNSERFLQSLEGVEVFACLEPDRKKAQFIEGCLQIAIGKRFSLGYYVDLGQRQNWLGKQDARETIENELTGSGSLFEVLKFDKRSLDRIILSPDTLEVISTPEGIVKQLKDYFTLYRDKENRAKCPF